MTSVQATLKFASRLIVAGLLLLGAEGHRIHGQTTFARTQRDYDNGLFEKVAESVKEQLSKINVEEKSVDCALLGAKSLIVLERFDEALELLDGALPVAKRIEGQSGNALAKIYLGYATLERARRQFRTSIEFAKKARAAVRNDRLINAEYQFSIGRTFYSKGNDISATIWFENALKSLEPQGDLGLTLDVYRFIGLASSARFDYAKAIDSYERLIKLSERSRFGHKYRYGLYELANILNATGQKKKGVEMLRKALQLSTTAQNFYLARVVLSSLLLNSLYEGDIASAEDYQKQLERVDSDGKFAYETAHGRAVIAAMRGEDVTADRYFMELAKLKGHSDYIVPYWKSTIAERRKDWRQVIQQNTQLLKLAEKNHLRDDLPDIYLGLGKAHHGLREFDKATDFANRAISMVEEARRSGDARFSFGLLEVYHAAYRLLVELKSENTDTAFEIADFIKGRALKDRIEQSPFRPKLGVPVELKNQIEEATSRFVDGSASVKEIEELERGATPYAAAHMSSSAVTKELNEIENLAGTAIISYLFTPGGLRAYVWTKGVPVRAMKLRITEPEIDALVTSTTKKIKDRVFFKKDGKAIYDDLLLPLNVDADRLVIIPDKSLWRIPFHALSPDSSSYLIEKKHVSYAPSVAMLLHYLKSSAPKRRTIRIFANNIYRDRFLRHVDSEARSIAAVFNSQPVFSATSANFSSASGDSDILHLAMHAELDPEEPLRSFLAFRPTGGHDGRLSVADLMRIRFKPQSLVFLASCDTANVLNGEGLVSLAWAILGSGSTSVISSQWEVDDKSTMTFTKLFYQSYRERASAAEALRKASLEMIRDKSVNFHEPYYWAAFTLTGDFR